MCQESLVAAFEPVGLSNTSWNESLTGLSVELAAGALQVDNGLLFNGSTTMPLMNVGLGDSWAIMVTAFAVPIDNGHRVFLSMQEQTAGSVLTVGLDASTGAITIHYKSNTTQRVMYEPAVATTNKWFSVGVARSVSGTALTVDGVVRQYAPGMADLVSDVTNFAIGGGMVLSSSLNWVGGIAAVHTFENVSAAGLALLQQGVVDSCDEPLEEEPPMVECPTQPTHLWNGNMSVDVGSNRTTATVNVTDGTPYSSGAWGVNLDNIFEVSGTDVIAQSPAEIRFEAKLPSTGFGCILDHDNFMVDYDGDTGFMRLMYGSSHVFNYVQSEYATNFTFVIDREGVVVSYVNDTMVQVAYRQPWVGLTILAGTSLLGSTLKGSQMGTVVRSLSITECS